MRAQNFWENHKLLLSLTPTGLPLKVFPQLDSTPKFFLSTTLGREHVAGLSFNRTCSSCDREQDDYRFYQVTCINPWLILYCDLIDWITVGHYWGKCKFQNTSFIHSPISLNASGHSANHLITINPSTCSCLKRIRRDTGGTGSEVIFKRAQLHSLCMYVHATYAQWTPSNPATLGTSQSVPIRGVASFQG